MRIRDLSAALLLASATTAPAYAQQAATATTTGTFTQVYLSAQDTNPVFSGVGTNQIRFGEPQPGWTITYTPSGPVAYSETPFFLGSITAFNGSIFTDTSISGLNLHLETVIDPAVNRSGDGLGILDEFISIFSTTNTDDPQASADYLGFESLALGAWILEGQQATFNLFGTVNSPLTIGSILVAPGSENSGFVAAITPFPIDQVTAAVPEPSTWALMLLGFGFAGAALRRSRSAATSLMPA